MADLLSVILIALMAPAATLFPLVYGLSGPWWKTWIGRALMTSSTGMALLIDISLLYKVFGDNYALRDVVRLSVYSIILTGTWMMLLSFVAEKWHAWRRNRDH